MEFGIFFSVDAAWMTRKTKRGSRPKAAWQAFLAAELTGRPALHDAGFRQIGGRLFLPIRLVAEDLAASYPNSIEDALGPVDAALEALSQAYPLITQIINAAALEFRLTSRR